MTFASLWYARLLSLFLFVSALLKIDQMIRDPFWEEAAAFPAAIVVVAAVLELCLAIWLLIPSQLHVAWIVASGMFVVFLVASLTAAVRGVPCGCLGSVGVSPWAMPVIDCLVLAGLTTLRPKSVVSAAATQFGNALSRPRLLGFNVGSAVCVGAVLFLLFSEQGRELLGSEQGFVVVEGGRVDLGDVHVGERVSFSVWVQNRSRSHATIIAGKASCTCVSLGPFPVDLPARDRQMISLSVVAPRDASDRLYQKFAFYLDHPRQQLVRGVVSARVSP